MTIEKLKRTFPYDFYCNINKRKTLKAIADTNCLDEWGCAYVSFGEDKVVEYNLCIDNTTNENINESAIYRVDYDEENDEYETDCSTFIHYEINFDNPKWRKELEDAMCDALIKFFEL